MLCCFARLYTIRVIRRFLITFSSLSIFFGIATIGMAFYLKKTEIWNSQSNPNKFYVSRHSWLENITLIQNLTFGLVIAFGGTSILIGILGFAQAKYKKCCTLGCLSFCTLFLTLFAGAFGALIITLGIYSRFYIKNYCSGIQPDNTTNIFARTFYELIEDLDNHPKNYVNNYMCSQQCPCTKPDFSQWSQEYQQKFEENKNNRYRFDGTYQNFESCYLDLVNIGTINAISSEELDLMKRMEKFKQCSGLCNKVPFYFFKNLTEGEPDDNCQNGLYQQFDIQIGTVGLSVFMCGLIHFLIFNVQYGYWRKKMSDKPPFTPIKERKNLSYLATEDASVSQIGQRV